MEGNPKDMSNPTKRPFQGMTSEKWINLAIAGLLVFYLAQFGVDMLWKITCGHIGVDFCDYWSAGKVANRLGYPSVYNLNNLGEVEKSIFPGTANPSLFIITPFPYLPVFVPLFQLFSLLPPVVGFWIWNAISTAIFIWYLVFLSRRLTGKPLPIRLGVFLFASPPVYLNIFYGQVDVWMVICVGEFMRAYLDQKPLRAGLWLAGLMIKPQVLVLVGLILLIQRSVKVLWGLISGTAVLLAGSFLMLGSAGFLQMMQLWLIYAQGIPSNGVEAMMNWRMLGLHLGRLVQPWLGTGIEAVGMLATVAIALYAWRKPFSINAGDLSIAVLGILSATNLVAWHSHVHVAMMLIPALIYLRQENILPQKAFDWWVLLPALLYIAGLFPENLIKFNILPTSAMYAVYWMRGAGEFGLNIYLLGWAVSQTRPARQREAVAAI